MARFRLTPPRIKLTENDIEKQCLDYLRARGYYPVRLQSGVFPAPDKLCDACRAAARWITVGEPGIPDYAILKDDFFLEVKAPGKQPSPQQIRKAFELVAGYRIRVATVDSLEHLLQWLDEHEKQ